MKRFAWTCVALLACYACEASDIAKFYEWESHVELGDVFALDPTRGETMILHPQILSYGDPMDLSTAWTVKLLYRPVYTNGVSTNVYSVTGSVLDGVNGRIEIRFGSSNELAASTYAYDVLVSSHDSSVVAARGVIKYRDGVASGAQLSTNGPIHILDFAQVQILNIGDAPWLSSYELSEIRDYLTSIQAGTGDIDVSNVTVRGTLIYTNWPSYLARTTDIPTGVITNAIKGNDEAVGRIERVDQHNITVHFPLVGEGEVTTTNRLYWIVEGQAVGYVSTNGITMTKGSLQLYEEDLNCNVRAYDGAKEAPSITFYSSPLSGWYRKSYAGAGAWCYAHNSNNVALISDYGWLLYGTRTFTGYGAELEYANVTGAYQVNGTNGVTTNLNVIVSGGATQTLHFVGGILQ